MMEQPQCATFIDVSSVKNSASHKGYLVLPFFSLTLNETSIFRPLPRSEASLLSLLTKAQSSVVGRALKFAVSGAGPRRCNVHRHM